MTERIYRSGAEENLRRRREEVYFLLLEGYSVEDIAEGSVYSKSTIQRDVAYIKAHHKEFSF